MIWSFLTVLSGTLASRLLGFLRDSLIAALLGTGAVGDAFLAAFQLVNVIRRLLTEGALNAAFVASRPQSLSTATQLARAWCAMRREEIFPMAARTLLNGVSRRHDHLVPDSGLRRLLRQQRPASRRPVLSCRRCEKTL